MKDHLLATFVLLSLALVSFGKDEPLTIADCPEPVRQAIQRYESSATVQAIGKDHKKKSGGPAVYEVKMLQKDGRLIEVTFSAEGAVLKTEDKKVKS